MKMPSQLGVCGMLIRSLLLTSHLADWSGLHQSNSEGRLTGARARVLSTCDYRRILRRRQTASLGLVRGTMPTRSCACPVLLRVNTHRHRLRCGDLGRGVRGSNWSGAPDVKQSHLPVQNGHYALARHAIGTGFVAAVLGTTLAAACFDSFFGFLPVLVSILLNLAQQEKLMSESFRRTMPTTEVGSSHGSRGSCDEKRTLCAERPASRIVLNPSARSCLPRGQRAPHVLSRHRRLCLNST